jgi:hypothetical protein
MNALSIFLGEFWVPFIGATFGGSVVWFAKRSASDGYLLFVGPKSFAELSGVAKGDQKRLLYEASKEAFPGLGSFLPVVVFAAMLAGGVALGQTLTSVTAVPNSMWFHALFAAIFGCLGGWIAGRLGVRRLRPFLIKAIERGSYNA